MKPLVIDTNVPIVANGRQGQPSLDCQTAAIKRLQIAVKSELILLDSEGEIQAEYQRHLHPKGQPGVGDYFYRHVLNSMPGRVERRDLPKTAEDEYQHFPASLLACKFDPSDRKFVALAKKEAGVVINATDSDWIHHADILRNEEIEVDNICGCDPGTWFQK